MNMNEIEILRVQPFLVGRETLGRTAGAVVRPKLISHIEGKRNAAVIQISLQGVRKIDVGFATEAIIAVFAQYRGVRPLCLIDVRDADVLENVTAAAERAGEPVTLWEGQTVRVIGRTPPRRVGEALEFALSRAEVRAGDFARHAGITVQNASNLFKQLSEEGLLLRQEGIAPSGGAEYTYRRIG